MTACLHCPLAVIFFFTTVLILYPAFTPTLVKTESKGTTSFEAQGIFQTVCAGHWSSDSSNPSPGNATQRGPFRDVFTALGAMSNQGGVFYSGNATCESKTLKFQDLPQREYITLLLLAAALGLTSLCLLWATFACEGCPSVPLMLLPLFAALVIGGALAIYYGHVELKLPRPTGGNSSTTQSSTASTKTHSAILQRMRRSMKDLNTGLTNGSEAKLSYEWPDIPNPSQKTTEVHTSSTTLPSGENELGTKDGSNTTTTHGKNAIVSFLSSTLNNGPIWFGGYIAILAGLVLFLASFMALIGACWVEEQKGGTNVYLKQVMGNKNDD